MSASMDRPTPPSPETNSDPALVRMLFAEDPTVVHFRRADGQRLRCPGCGWYHRAPNAQGLVVSWGLVPPAPCL